jgi:hypothetical protein
MFLRTALVHRVTGCIAKDELSNLQYSTIAKSRPESPARFHEDRAEGEQHHSKTPQLAMSNPHLSELKSGQTSFPPCF